MEAHLVEVVDSMIDGMGGALAKHGYGIRRTVKRWAGDHDLPNVEIELGLTKDGKVVCSDEELVFFGGQPFFRSVDDLREWVRTSIADLLLTQGVELPDTGEANYSDAGGGASMGE